jgi:sugar lactone lactonase YvrE
VGDVLIQQVTEPEALLAESPLWDEANRRLLWVDIERGDVHSLDLDGNRRESWRVGQMVGSVRLAEDGRLVLGLEDGVHLGDETNRQLVRIANLEAERPAHRLNDSACDAAGRLWIGSMRIDASGRDGALFRVEFADGAYEATRMIHSVGISNGIGWSLDGTVMYFIDTPTNRVDALDFNVQTGEIAKRRPLIDLAPARPDGMAVDSEGFLWVAIPSHGQVRRYSPAGRLEGMLEFPCRRVTSCCFGGEGLKDLFVTTAKDREPESPGEAASPGGALFRCRPGPTGQLTTRFRIG